MSNSVVDFEAVQALEDIRVGLGHLADPLLDYENYLLFNERTEGVQFIYRAYVDSINFGLPYLCMNIVPSSGLKGWQQFLLMKSEAGDYITNQFLIEQNDYNSFELLSGALSEGFFVTQIIKMNVWNEMRCYALMIRE